MMENFVFASTPQVHFGSGKISVLPAVAKSFGTRVLLVTGARSFLSSPAGTLLMKQLNSEGLTVEFCNIDREPTPAMVDRAVADLSAFSASCVVAIGGGSVLDAGKAISAMLPLGAPVKDFLEGVGTRKHPGIKIPFIAMPTTAGTGSEATKNAVLSETGENGYKRSLRHEKFVPDIAIIDPLLTISCAPLTTAASGMDAFTQLLESYLSTSANSITDALAFEGLKHISQSLRTSYAEGGNIRARTAMALAAFLSGIALANAGLGLVHGFAGSIGGFFDIPHGIICSRLMAPVNKLTVRELRLRNSDGEGLKKYAATGAMFSGAKDKTDAYYIDSLLETIESMTNEMRIPSLSRYGFTTQHFEKIAAHTEQKNNPVRLSQEALMEVLEAV